MIEDLIRTLKEIQDGVDETSRRLEENEERNSQIAGMLSRSARMHDDICSWREEMRREFKRARVFIWAMAVLGVVMYVASGSLAVDYKERINYLNAIDHYRRIHKDSLALGKKVERLEMEKKALLHEVDSLKRGRRR